MQKIADIIMNKKFIPVFLALVIASLFIASRSQGRSDEDDPKSRYEKILKNVGMLLEEGHFSPKKIDDAFSKEVLKKFTNELDGEKNILLQQDIESFQKFETTIDDEIHGSELKSFFAINDLYQKRMNETANLFSSILDRPFDFNIDES